MKRAKILRAGVVGVYDLSLCLTGGRAGAEGHHNARIVLIRVVFDVLASGPAHFESRRRGGLDENLLGQVQPYLVCVNAGVKASLAELLGHVFSSLVIFRGAGDVRLSGESAEMLARELGSGTARNFCSSFCSAAALRKPVNVSGAEAV